MRLSAEQRRCRVRFDWEVIQPMNDQIFKAEAYRSTTDLERRRNPITSVDDAHLATKYRVDFYVPTLIAPDKFVDTTAIGFDLSTGNYPYSEPATWIISGHVPYSPHFKRGAPVCIGEIWREARGTMLLGQLFVHVARLLNWDEVARGGGYVGWNADAIAYHRKRYGNRPLDPTLQYPSLPTHLTHDITAPQASLFSPSLGSTNGALLFGGNQLDNAPADLFSQRT